MSSEMSCPKCGSPAKPRAGPQVSYLWCKGSKKPCRMCPGPDYVAELQADYADDVQAEIWQGSEGA